LPVYFSGGLFMTKPHIKAHSFIPQNINNFLQHHVLHFLRGFNFVLDRNLVIVQHKFNSTSMREERKRNWSLFSTKKIRWKKIASKC
jgi:hypothetical protein